MLKEWSDEPLKRENEFETTWHTAQIEGKKDDAAGWARGKVYEVIDSRIGMATIYTTNFTGKKLFEMYGERDFSRMVQYCTTLKIEGKNHRLENFL